MSGWCMRCAEVASDIKRNKVRGQRQPHPPAPPCLLGEEDGGCPVLRGDDELSARRRKATSAVRSRERLFTLTNQVLISSESGSHGDNWLIIHDPPLRSARINGRARRIPHSQSVLKWDDMGFFTSKKIGGILPFALALFSLVVSGNPTGADVRCENVYKDFSGCVLELGASMDNYQENVTSEKGVAAVCSHWEAFHTCALTALADCREEVSSIWETLRQASKKMRIQGSLFDLCSPSSSPRMRSPFALLALTPIVVLIATEPIWSFG